MILKVQRLDMPTPYAAMLASMVASLARAVPLMLNSRHFGASLLRSMRAKVRSFSA